MVAGIRVLLAHVVKVLVTLCAAICVAQIGDELAVLNH
jgi:hypothetical protein